MAIKIPERRSFGRRTTTINGQIAIPGRPPLPCIVRNYSTGGALIETNEPVWLPYRFILVLQDTSSSFDCEIKHQSRNRTGVRFVEPASQSTDKSKTQDNPTAADDWIGTRELKQLTPNRRAGK